jgi:uncharacterized protein YukE
MTSDRHLALMALMNEIDEPAKTFQRHVRAAAKLASNTREWDSAVERGNAALDDIEQAVRRWVAKHPEQPADFTEARTVFMQIGRTPSLEGLRAELRIDGQRPIVGRYVGASMGRMHDVPGHEHLLAVDPRLVFEYADEQPAEACGKCKTPFDPDDTRFDGHARYHLTPYCRSCVDRCHDNEIADHRCVICA